MGVIIYHTSSPISESDKYLNEVGEIPLTPLGKETSVCSFGAVWYIKSGNLVNIWKMFFNHFNFLFTGYPILERRFMTGKKCRTLA